MASDTTKPAQGAGPIGHIVDGRFEILEEIGAGAMGKVYRARQLSLGIERALKVIGVAGGAAEEAARARFRREALAMSRLQHPGIAQIIEFGTLPEGTYFLVMEYVEGEDLQHRIERTGPLPLRESIEILTQIAQAVAYAQSQGIVHRDLKPANVLLQGGDVTRVKVIDFGLAKLLTDEQLTQLTADEQMLGTPIFMSPEQCLCQAIGAPTDVYALAGIAYYCISGLPVFVAKTMPKIILAQTYEQPSPLSARCPELSIPPELDTLLLDCLLKDPAGRPSPANVVQRLQALAPGLAQAAAATPTASPPKVDLAATVLSQPDVLASSIWLDHPPTGALLEEGSRTALQEALFNQITDQVDTLAARLEVHLGLTATLGALVSHIKSIQSNISDVEMDLALLQSELSDLGAHSVADNDRLQRQAHELTERIRKLILAQNREYRNLFQYVVSYRSEVRDPDLLTGYDELQELIQEYLGARQGTSR